jgi:hypothetical protein
MEDYFFKRLAGRKPSGWGRRGRRCKNEKSLNHDHDLRSSHVIVVRRKRDIDTIVKLGNIAY